MEQSKIDMFIATNMAKFPAARIPMIKEKLAALEDEKMMMVQCAEYKDPTTMLIISLLVGGLGVDRFLLGDTTMGILKLITSGGCGIWWLIDLFSIQDKAREYNFKKIMQTIDPTNIAAYM